MSASSPRLHWRFRTSSQHLNQAIAQLRRARCLGREFGGLVSWVVALITDE